MLRRFVAILLLLIGTGWNTAWADATEFRMITLQHRFADDILPVVEPMVGPTGSARALDNHLLITTTLERMAAIDEIIAKLDVQRKNVRITISHEDVRETERQRAGVSGRARVGDAEIRLPGDRRGDVAIDIERNETASSQQGSQFLTVLDGERAFIRIGQSVPYTQQWLTLTQRYASVQQTTQFRDITTGFSVRPRYIGNQVELEVAPRIARPDSAGFVDFEALSTVVQVTPGKWFDLGGTMQSRDEISRAILSGQESGSRRNSVLMIKVD